MDGIVQHQFIINADRVDWVNPLTVIQRAISKVELGHCDTVVKGTSY